MAVLVISYSRVDQRQVRALVTLLKGGLRGVDQAVYWDDQFEPGEPWFEQLKMHIDASPQLFVFWCAHSSISKEVRREFTYALEQKKRVVPVLLDETPLAPELSPIAGIDLRGAVQHLQSTSVTLSAEQPASRATGSRLVLLATAAALVLVAGTGAFFMLRTHQSAATDGQATFPSGAVASASTPAPTRAGEPPKLVPAAAISTVTIDTRPSLAASPDGLTDASRAEIDRMFRDVSSSKDVRIAIKSPGRGPSMAANRARNELIRTYIAKRHNVPLDRIDIASADAASGTATASGDRTTISVQTIGPGGATGPAIPEPPIEAPSAETHADRAGIFALAAVAMVVALAAALRMFSAWRKRRSIVREFERYWVGSPD